MKFSMRDRFVLLNILPPEGDIVTIKIVHRLKQELAPSDKEYKDYKISAKDGQVMWDDAVDKKRGPKEVELGGKAFSIIEEQFKILNDKKKLVEGQLETYLKFFEDEKKE